MWQFDWGDLARFSVTFTDAVGTATDPTTITYRLLHPDGTTETTYNYGTDAALIRDGVGAYHADVLLTTVGYWAWRWEGTGAVQAAVEGRILAIESPFS
jgi:hypothetical protein